MKITTLALVGVGNWGKNFIKTINNIPDCELKYLCDKASNLKALQEKFIHVSDYHDLFNKDIDGIIIATPGFTHFQIARDFIKMNKNILVEKPFTTSYKEAIELQKLSKQKQSIVMVGHTQLYNPAYLKTKEVSEKIGKLRYIDFEWTNYGPFRNDISALWDWGPHAVSIITDLVGKSPVSISAKWVESLRPQKNLCDMVFVSFDFGNKVSAFIKIGWLSPVRERRTIVVGSRSSIVLDEDLEKKIIYFRNLGPTVKNNLVYRNETEISYPKYNLQTPLELEILEFVNSIKNNKKPKTNIDHAVETTRILSLIEKSVKNGKA